MPNAAEVAIKGREELERAFLEVRREVLLELKPAIAQVANEVRQDAETRAGAEISNIGPRWQRMRLGVTLKAVYIAPRSRRQGGSPRKNLAGLLMDRAMQPALDEHGEKVVHRISEVCDAAAARHLF